MWIIALKSSIITFLGLIIYGLLLLLLGPSSLGSLQYVAWGLGIYSAHYYYKAANDGLMSYIQGLKLGLLVSSLTGLCSSLVIYFYTSTVPGAINTLQDSLRNILKHQDTDEVIITQVIQFVDNVTPSFLFFGTLISTVFLGFFITLFISAFARNSQKL